MPRWVGALALLGLLVVPATSAASVAGALERATVWVGAGCTGVLVERSQLVATALHCLPKDAHSIEVRLSSGAHHSAWVVGTDADADQAVLFIPEDVDLVPLRIALVPPIAGTVLYFGGRPDRFRVREARIERVGTCASLPALAHALFTTLDGTPGDSGAALVDGGARIAGLVHGGARCEIATPGSTLAALVREVLRPGA